ncbi:30S ribosomal protein S9 [archaeon]|jgi:small subunit ribosomal protein S9|nr:30S ribosomal protein S9 [archaeon]MBT3577874.1 30S ribosomal protein S9 [archaeon]MBT6819762.1 30S ribosomal protein S9 [archaeon]MBT6955969.1 30S ribosomal protein S9 [archaeon]MBT7025544.1 30S ribosomal protein S9 [archaeon]
MNGLVVSGKRKTAVAKATIVEGTGNVTFNKKPLTFLPELQQLEISEPLILAEDVLGDLKFDIALNVSGGGLSCQVEAARLAIAKAIVQFTGDKNVRNSFLAYDRNLLVADTRRKEACKPGDSKARSMRQSSKR